jgi:hypothetical protein
MLVGIVAVLLRHVFMVGFIVLVSCDGNVSRSGYVNDKEYSYCKGNPHVDDGVVYCDNRKLDCLVTLGEFVNGEYKTHRVKYEAHICPFIEVGDFIP